ncbi:ABC transporter permease [Clostridium sediminicola]|uniref:ABC transporter permease n=1 Tax=Clostridium sediminicola TaxID=3114879 RepID=UPI0031F1D959
MEFSMKKVNALFIKETKDLKKNANILLMSALPIIFSLIYSRLFKSSEGVSMILATCTNMNFCMVASFVIAMLIAEEKEKNTLKTLMLSGVSPMEFLLGKALVTILIANFSNIFIFIIFGLDFQYFVQFFIVGLILSISMVIIGAVIGLLSKNQMASGTVGMPITMGFLIIPTLASLNKTFEIIANFIPTYHANKLMENLINGESLLSGKVSILVLLVWIVIASLAFAYVYKIKKLDE